MQSQDVLNWYRANRGNIHYETAHAVHSIHREQGSLNSVVAACGLAYFTQLQQIFSLVEFDVYLDER
jgi:hypothetical protein